MKKIFFLILINLLFFCECFCDSFILKEVKSTGLFIKGKNLPEEIIKIILKNNSEKSYENLKILVENKSFSPNFLEIKNIKGFQEISLKYRVSYNNEEKIKDILILQYEDKKEKIDFEFQREKPDLKIFIVTHFHYDPVWISKRGQIEYAEKAIDLVKQYIEMCKIYPYWTFVLHELSYLKPFWDFYPEYREEIRNLIKNKNLEIVGGSYNQPDQANPFGEGLIRNFIYGRAFQKKLQEDIKSGWQIDCFGHTPQYPQLLKKSGISSFTFLRGGPKGHPSDFYWMAPDGTSIYSYDLGGPREALSETISEFGKKFQNQNITPTLIKKAEEELLPKLLEKLKTLFSTRNIFIPAGDDFSPPLKELSLLSSYVNSKYLSPQIIFITPKQFFEIVEKENTSPRIITKDLNPVFSGCYTTRIDLKIANRLCENTLISAEKFSTIAYLLGANYPSKLLDKAWRKLIFNQHHDCIPGTSNEISTLDIISIYRESLDLASLVLNRAINFISKNIETQTKIKNAKPLIVFNQLPWERKDIIRVSLREIKIESFDLVDEKGVEIPYSLEEDKIIFIGEIPSFGYKIFYFVPSQKKNFENFKAEEREIENEYYKISFSKNGEIISIYDKENKKEIIDKNSIYFANEIIAQKENSIGDSLWTISLRDEIWRSSTFPAKIEKYVNYVYSKMVVIGDFLGCKRIQEIILYRGIKRIDFKTYLIGYNKKEYFFKVVFPTNIKDGAPLYDERFTSIYRQENIEFPSYNFVDYRKGVKISAYDIDGNPVNIPSLRSCGIVIERNSKERDSAIFLLENLSKYKITSCMFFDKREEDETLNITIYIGDIFKNKNISDELTAQEKEKLKKILNTKGRIYLSKISLLILKNREEVEKFIKELREENSGIALINSGNTGYTVKNGFITLSLLRSPTDPHSPEYYGFNTSHQNWDHLFCYSLYPHLQEEVTLSEIKRVAEEFNNPLISVISSSHKGILKEKEFSFLNIEEKNIFLSCLKLKGYPEAEYKGNFKYSPEIILRVYEYEGRETFPKISFFSKIKRVYKSNFEEDELEVLKTEKNEFSFRILPFSVETFGFETENLVKLIKEDLDIKKEFIQPVYSKFYKYNLGAESIGNQPVNISIEPEREETKEKIRAKLKISSDYQDKTISGVINLNGPKCFKISPEKIKYKLNPGEYKIYDISLTSKGKIETARIFAYLKYSEDTYFDVLKIGKDSKILEVEYPDKIKLEDEAEIKVNIKNISKEKVEGAIFLISPVETWGEYPYFSGFIEINPFCQKMEILPSQEKIYSFKIRKINKFSEKFFAVIKLAYNGELFYGKPILISKEN
jgi:alpha-mannosidase